MVREPDGLVKVGFSVDPERRVKSGRTWIPEGLDLFGVWRVRDMEAVEGDAHDVLRPWRLTEESGSGSEWFSVTPDQAAKTVERAAGGRHSELGKYRMQFKLRAAQGVCGSLRRWVFLAVGWLVTSGLFALGVTVAT